MSALEGNTDVQDQRHDLETTETRNTGDTTNCEPSSVEMKPRCNNVKHLWEFLLELLADESCNSLIAWSRKTHGEFRIKNPEQVARRWGNLKRKEGMNYKKLSRGLRHYYNQGIIEKVKGQRFVYRFHKLPYQYTLRKTNNPDKPRMLPTNSKSEGEYSFRDCFSSTEDESLDKSERKPTDKEKMKKIFQERLKAKKNKKQTKTKNKPIHTAQEDEDVPSTTPSPQSSTTSLLPQVSSESLKIPIPIRPSLCETVYPVPADGQKDPVSYGLQNHGVSYIPVSVIKRLRSTETDAAGKPNNPLNRFEEQTDPSTSDPKSPEI